MNSSNTAVIILAAGSSARMGSPKQLLDFGGKPLIRHAAETALASGCQQMIVVLGSRAELICAALDGLALEIVENPRWEEGMGTSIQVGIHEAMRLGCTGAILALADQPFVTPEILAGLVNVHRRTGKPIVTSEYSGTVGVPVFFAASYFPHLLGLQPEHGCKGVIVKNAEHAVRVPCPEAEIDIDTPADYDRFTAPAR